jgi:polysaccharide biosynthesis protein PslG
MTRLAAVAAALALALLVPAAAQARPGGPVMLGIGDQHARMFDDPLFTWLGLRTARIVVAWDVERIPYERERVATWLDRTRALGIDPLVAFGRTWDRHGNRLLPTLSQYRWAFRRFREAHPDVTAFIPWNEANHPKQPTWKRPDMAGHFYNAMRAECPACRLVAADVLDTPGMTRYVEKYQRVLREQPAIWGMHNYGDAYGRKSTATRQMLRITTGELWLTETGGVVRRPRGRVGVPMRRRLRDAAGATRYVLRLATSKLRIKRAYLYQWAAVDDAPWDSALLSSDRRLRPAFKVAAQFLQRDVTRAPRR